MHFWPKSNLRPVLGWHRDPLGPQKCQSKLITASFLLPNCWKHAVSCGINFMWGRSASTFPFGSKIWYLANCFVKQNSFINKKICYIPSFDMQMFKTRIIPYSCLPLYLRLSELQVLCIKTSILLLENLYVIHLRFRIAN